VTLEGFDQLPLPLPPSAEPAKLGPIEADPLPPQFVDEEIVPLAPWQMVIPVVNGNALFVSITSSADAVQGAFEIVHLNVALVPAGTPVTPDVGEVAVVIVAVPLTKLHAPVPTVGVLPARVKLPLLQLVKSAPALAVVGRGLTVIVTVFEVAGLPVEQVAFEVMRTVIEAPLVKVVDVYVTPVAPPIGVAPLYHW
jgi:hypothetical protein